MSGATAVQQKPSSLPVVTGRSRKLLWFGIFIVIVLIGAIFAVAYHTVSQTRVSMEQDVMQRQQTVGATRVETTEAWLDSLVELAKLRLLDSGSVFSGYAAEVAKLPDSVPLPLPPLQDDIDDGAMSTDARLGMGVQLMRTMIAGFVETTSFTDVKVVNSKGSVYMSTSAGTAMPPLSSAQRAVVQRVIEHGLPVFAPVELQTQGLALDLYMPILPPSEQGLAPKPVAVLIATHMLDGKLGEILSPGVVSEKGRTQKLVQKNGDIYLNVSLGATMLRQVADFPIDNSDGSLPFGLRKAIGENRNVYSSGLRLRLADWWIVTEHDASLISDQLAEKSRTAYMLAGLVSVALVLLFSAVWWRLIGQEQCTINAQITSLLDVINEQKTLLDGINSTISDPISLTDSKGMYRYVNSAFAEAVGRSVDDVIGLDGPAVFGFDTAKRLNASDQHVLMTGESVSITEVLWLQSKRYHFQISKTPLKDPTTRAAQGIVSVFRDITQIVETQERSRRVVQQTIDALVRTIEEADPFLGGHSRIMGGLAALMAKQLRLTERDTATIEAAANLSQIGKMFVPREILLKPGALTAEEKAEMERHVEYARNVLKDIEFDLPVVDTIYQMNERLDGTGYPKGLTGDEISVHAKVLAVANAFTAMAKPRSYRPALPVDEAVAILEKQAASYEPEVVAVLRQVIATPAGERLVEQAAASKAV